MILRVWVFKIKTDTCHLYIICFYLFFSYEKYFFFFLFFFLLEFLALKRNYSHNLVSNQLFYRSEVDRLVDFGTKLRIMQCLLILGGGGDCCKLFIFIAASLQSEGEADFKNCPLGNQHNKFHIMEKSFSLQVKIYCILQ